MVPSPSGVAGYYGPLGVYGQPMEFGVCLGMANGGCGTVPLTGSVTFFDQTTGQYIGVATEANAWAGEFSHGVWLDGSATVTDIPVMAN